MYIIYRCRSTSMNGFMNAGVCARLPGLSKPSRIASPPSLPLHFGSPTELLAGCATSSLGALAGRGSGGNIRGHVTVQHLCTYCARRRGMGIAVCRRASCKRRRLSCYSSPSHRLSGGAHPAANRFTSRCVLDRAAPRSSFPPTQTGPFSSRLPTVYVTYVCLFAFLRRSRQGQLWRRLGRSVRRKDFWCPCATMVTPISSKCGLSPFPTFPPDRPTVIHTVSP